MTFPKQISIYNTTTGEIRYAGKAWKQELLDEMVGAGEAFVDGFYSPEDYRVEDGVPVETLSNSDPDTREMRNNMLTETDWTQLPDNGLTEEQRAAWRTYRQRLRDLPDHVNWPNLELYDWPSKP